MLACFKSMYEYFGLSNGEKVECYSLLLETGVKVDVRLPDRISNEQIAKFFYDTAPFNILCGMNESVNSVVVPVKTIDGTVINVCFNRG